MSLIFRPGVALGRSYGAEGLFGAWLESGVLGGGSASSEIQALLAEDQPGSAAPLFAAVQQQGSGGTWWRTMQEDMSSSRDQALLPDSVARLASGQARAVITGQQPGALGGPLYTLYKVATTVALAHRLSDLGRPTVPVFWSGDDDDDLDEALAPLGWQPREYSGNGEELFPVPRFRQARSLAAGARPCVGQLPAGNWSVRARQWLKAMEQNNHLSPLGCELARLWRQAVDENWSWSRLSRRYILRLFADQGLLVVSGNDPFLHRTAEPLYRRILEGRPELVSLAQEQGRHLARGGFSHPISERSLHRHLFQSRGEGRVFLGMHDVPDDVAHLRPGVLLRSCVQDWLFRPAAVVVGPGELAYLRQLDPVFAALGIPRSPLVPRLFGWIVPRGFAAHGLPVRPGSSIPSAERLQQLAREAGQVAEDGLVSLLARELELPPEAARHLAAGRSRRWQRGVAGLLRTVARQQQQAATAALPALVWPQGQRQERTLGSLCLAALLGQPLLDAVLDAAQAHLQEGEQGRWHEFVAEGPWALTETASPNPDPGETP